MASYQQLYDFMAVHPYMVISSLSNSGAPQSAVVGFGVSKNLELIFGTSVSNRKAKNITNDGRVSTVIGWDSDGTVQYEGTAHLLTGKDIDTYSKIYFSKNPLARRHKDNPDERYFLVKPGWIRFTDASKDPWYVEEFEF
jgi:pyridoxine/pyridoxamine 5'-phosphate oxidase